jgi:hypothetical protein
LQGLRAGHDASDIRIFFGVERVLRLTLGLTLLPSLGLLLLPLLPSNFFSSLLGCVVRARFHSLLLPALLTTATTTAKAAAISATTATAAAAEAATSTAVGTLARFADRNRTTLELFAVQRLHGVLRAGVRRHLDEGEATRPTGVAIEHQLHFRNVMARRHERITKIRLGGRIRQVANVKSLSHLLYPSAGLFSVDYPAAAHAKDGRRSIGCLIRNAEPAPKSLE